MAGLPGVRVVLGDGGCMMGASGCPRLALHRVLGTGIGPIGVRRFGWRHLCHCGMHLHRRFACPCCGDSRERSRRQTEREYEDEKDLAPTWHGRSLPRTPNRYVLSRCRENRAPCGRCRCDRMMR